MKLSFKLSQSVVRLSPPQDESETESEESSEESSSEESTEEEEEEEEKVIPISKKVHRERTTVIKPRLVYAPHDSFCVTPETDCPLLLAEEDRVKRHQAQRGDLSTDPGQL